MFLAAAALLVLLILVGLFWMSAKDLPAPQPVSPHAHLDARKEQIYDNLRDLQFEYRVGKLSDADYQLTKTGLQNELAQVLAEIDGFKAAPAAVPAAVNGKPKPAKPAVATAGTQCPHCQAKFPQRLKFCGECGKPMEVNA